MHLKLKQEIKICLIQIELIVDCRRKFKYIKEVAQLYHLFYITVLVTEESIKLHVQ